MGIDTSELLADDKNYHECDCKIRPNVPANDREVVCLMTTRHGAHTTHRGILTDYARGQTNQITWEDDDQRNFHGNYPGRCIKHLNCILPNGHSRMCTRII